MKKSDITIVILLFLCLLAWPFYQRAQRGDQPVVPPGGGEQTASPGQDEAVALPDKNPVKPAESPPEAPPAAPPVQEPAPPAAVHSLPEKKVVLSNDAIRVTLSSWGGSIVSAELRDYRSEVDEASGPVILDFAATPALSLNGVPGATTNDDWTFLPGASATSATLSATLSSGLLLERRVSLQNGYSVRVTDRFSNPTAREIELPGMAVELGPMQSVRTRARTRGYATLGIDTLSASGGKEIAHWVKSDAGEEGKNGNLSQRFQPKSRRGGGCAMFKPKLDAPLPHRIAFDHKDDLTWVAVKNKFFVQVLTPEMDAAGARLRAGREVPEREDPSESGTWAGVAELDEVSAALTFGDQDIAPEGFFVRAMNYYVGPKKFEALQGLGHREDEIMFYAWWAWFRWLCVKLLWVLNLIYRFIPNYGIAIILLTLLVRLIFWPITHKSTQSMKKMQEIQPLVNALREKHKNDPQKLQQETMALYKEHKVNPMAGCLPILVQMPVFIALFNVLRSAVELRFAPFLWIRDLSEPEGLFAGSIPLVDELNILPLVMTGITLVQQKMTPSSGDPQQQRMMMFMPVMFLFLFYKMPSALVLYWTVSQLIAVAQLVIQRYRSKQGEAGKAEG